MNGKFLSCSFLQNNLTKILNQKFQNLLLNSVNFKKYLATILCKINFKGEIMSQKLYQEIKDGSSKSKYQKIKQGGN